MINSAKEKKYIRKSSESKIPGVVAVISSILWIVIVGANNFLLPSLVTTVSVMILMKKRIQGSVTKEVEQLFICVWYRWCLDNNQKCQKKKVINT